VAFASIFASFAKLGLDSLLVRDLIHHPSKVPEYLGTAFWLKLLGAIVSLAIVSIILTFIGEGKNNSTYVLIVVAGTVFQSFEVIDFYFRSQVLSKFVSICRLTQLLLSSILKVYLVMTGADLVWFVIVILIDQITLAVALLISYHSRKLPNFLRFFDLKLAKSLFKDSWPLMLSGFVLMLQARVDQIMLKEFIGDAELGYYSSALRLIEVFGFIPMLITTSLYPAIINARKSSIYLFKERLFNLYRLMMGLFLITAIPISLFANHIVVFLYKDAYAPAGPLLSLLALRLFFTNYGVARGAYLIAENLTKFSLISMTIGTFTNIGLNYLLIPTYQAVGSIYASLFSFLISTFLLDCFYPKTRANLKLMFHSLFIVKKLNVQSNY
jgi:O-antigen/teichoic acid export membrane protein